MVDSLLYDGSGLFESPIFHGVAMEFFSTIGHTSDVSPLIVADDILRCIYSELNFTAYFEKTEREAFSCIESLSHLFTLGRDVFYENRGSQIRYYAVSLNTEIRNRTVVANTVINAFAKNMSDYIVILFRHEMKCMLSFTKKANSFLTVFSDWFDEASVFEIASRVDIGNLSLQNSTEFFLDFVYMAARKYYIEPISKEYALSEWYYMNPLSDADDNWPVWNDYTAEIFNAHIFQYGDDYIDVPDITDYQIDDFNSNDIDFDLLELELDEMMAADAFETDDDDYEYEDESEYSDELERINASDIPPEILSDPVKLLEWLKQNERPKEQ